MLNKPTKKIFPESKILVFLGINSETHPCGEVFPFGLFSNDTRVIIEELILNQGYQIRLAETGEFSIFKCLADTV